MAPASYITEAAQKRWQQELSLLHISMQVQHAKSTHTEIYAVHYCGCWARPHTCKLLCLNVATLPNCVSHFIQFNHTFKTVTAPSTELQPKID